MDDQELHSRKDNEIESRDQSIFGHVVMWTGVALIVIFLVGLLVVRFAGRLIHPDNPNKHPTSQVVMVSPNEWDA